METLFGAELSLPAKFFIAFAVVLVLIGAIAYLVRRFGAKALSAGGQRGRQPRLAVVDAAPLDNRRRLVIIRRDNVEHLLLIGGPTDVLIEPNIVRAVAAQTAREIPPARVSPAEVPPAHPLPESASRLPPPDLGPRPQRPAFEEATPWPLQPQAEPTVRPAVEPPLHQPAAVEPPLRVSAADAFVTRPAAVSAASEPATAMPADHLAGPAAGLQRPAAEPIAPRPQLEAKAPVRPLPLSDDQNIADMAKRLEAALRRPLSPAASAPAQPAAAEPAPAAAVAPAARSKPAAEPPRAPPPPAPPAQDQHADQNQDDAFTYESLQREMASLLGRPPSGSS